MALFCVGLNHQVADLSVRERFAVHDLPAALTNMKEQHGIQECLLLSTCNRTEWVVVAEHLQAVYAWFQARADVAPILYAYEGQKAALHMMQVAAGLDSMMLGETQIFGQLKDAFRAAQAMGTVKTILSRLGQMTFQVAKKVRHETEINTHAVSMAGAAVQLASQIFASLVDTRVLLLGAGETISDVAQHLTARGCHALSIASRQVENAAVLAKRFNAESLSLLTVHDHLHKVDMIITATRSTLPILGKGAIERAMKQRKHKPLLLIDLGVPRDIEPEVANLADIYLYNVDDLLSIVSENQAIRQKAARVAEVMLKEKADEFETWYETRGNHRLVAEYRGQADDIRNEIEKEALSMLKAGTPPEKVLMWQSRTLMQKLLHLPTERIKSLAFSEDPALLDRLISIFRSH